MFSIGDTIHVKSEDVEFEAIGILSEEIFTNKTTSYFWVKCLIRDSVEIRRIAIEFNSSFKVKKLSNQTQVAKIITGWKLTQNETSKLITSFIFDN